MKIGEEPRVLLHRRLLSHQLHEIMYILKGFRRDLWNRVGLNDFHFEKWRSGKIPQSY